MKHSIIIPFRNAGGGRLENLLFVLSWLAPRDDLEVIVVEQDSKSRLGHHTLPANCTCVFTYNKRAFNKSWGCNVGCQQASGEVLALADADMFTDLESLMACFDECAHTYDAVKPYATHTDLTRRETGKVLAGNRELAICPAPDRRDRRYKGEFLNFCGGIFVIRREVYQRLGGFDERFVGWGGEDDAMAIKINVLVPNTKTLVEQVAYHLYHKSTRPRPRFNRNYRSNLRLLREYRAMSRDALVHLCDLHRQSMGDAEKFRTNNYILP